MIETARIHHSRDAHMHPNTRGDAALEAENTQLRTQNNWLKVRNNELRSGRDTAMQDRDALLLQRTAWLRERDGMQRAARLMKPQINDVVNHNIAATLATTSLSKENTALNAENHGLRRTITSLSTENATLRLQNESQNDALRAMEEENRIFKKTIELFKVHVETVENGAKDNHGGSSEVPSLYGSERSVPTSTTGNGEALSRAEDNVRLNSLVFLYHCHILIRS
jgi:cell division protein FtsB